VLAQIINRLFNMGIEAAARAMKRLLVYLVVASILLGVAVGYACRASAVDLKPVVLALAVATITPSMVVMRVGGLLEAARRWREVVLGLALIFVASPLAAMALSRLLDDPGLAVGFVVSNIVPASSASLSYVLIAGGDLELATVLAMLSIVGALAAIPGYLRLYAASCSISVPMAPIMRSLLVALVLPLVVGQGVRKVLERRRALARSRPVLQLITMTTLLGLIATLVATHAQTIVGRPLTALELTALLGASIGTVMALSELLTRWLRVSRCRRVSITILAATKNQSVAAAIAVTALGGSAALAPALAPSIQPVLAMMYLRAAAHRERNHISSQPQPKRVEAEPLG